MGGLVISRTAVIGAMAFALAAACGPASIEPRPLPTRPSVRAEKVGAGFVVTELPKGEKVATNRRGDPVVPKVTKDFDGRATSNSWWSSLIWQFDAQNPYSYNLHAHPLVLRAAAGGLAIAYPTDPAIAKREYMYRFSADLVAGLAGLKSPDARVAAYSDWAVTAEWRTDRDALRATFGHGMPFVYFTKTGPAAASVRVASDKSAELTVWREEGPVVGITVGKHHYGLFGPSRTQWTRTGSVFTSDLGGRDYFSVAVLPDAKPETLEVFRQHAYVFVTKTRVSWSYEEKTADVETKFEVTSVPKEQGRGVSNEPLLALYRHQWLATRAPLLAYAYVSPRGAMKVVQGSSFTTRTKFPGVLPILPNVDKTNTSELESYVNDVQAADDLFPKGFGAKPGRDAYWIGKSLGRNASVLEIAHQLGLGPAKQRLLRALENQLEDWFDGHAPSQFYFDEKWRTLVGFPASYGSSEQINDHHFHYGYFVAAAATVARFDPAWVARFGPFVELLIRDVANWDRTDRRFPFLRYMDAYAGHSWANGPAQFEEGNNQEASSEDINLSAAITLWGAVTDNRTIRDLGIFLYANQVAAVEQYWFDVDHEVFPKGFEHSAVGMVWGAGAKYDTWFDQDPIIVHGINFLPFTGASLYLGRHPEYVRRNSQEIFRDSRGIVNTWRDYVMMYLALGDPAKAWDLLHEDPYFEPEFGNSKALVHHWISNLRAIGGHVDPTVTADTPTFAVFKGQGKRTYVALNPTAAKQTVTFSDGATVPVAPREITYLRRNAGAQP